MSAALLTRLAKLEKEIKEIKSEISKGLEKPNKIEECKTIEQVNGFKISDLKAWILKNKIKVKAIDELYKADIVKIVWKNLKKTDEADAPDEDYESEDVEDGDDDGYEWYWY